MARVPASRPFTNSGSRLAGGPPSGPGGRAGGDISGTWMVTVNGRGRSEYLFEYRPSGEVTGKGRPAAGGDWLSDLKGFHEQSEQGGKFTWTSYVNNRESGRFEATVASDLKSFGGSGTLITGMRLSFLATRTTPEPPGALATPVAHPPQSLAREVAERGPDRNEISMQGVSPTQPSASDVRAEQDAEYQVGLIRDQAKDLEQQLSRARSDVDDLEQQMNPLALKVQNVKGQMARYGENPKNTAELEKAEADLEEAKRPLADKSAKVAILQAELNDKNELLAAVAALD